MHTAQPDGRGDRAGRSWEVLLLGGASGVGKSTVAARLARHFAVGLAQADGYRLLLERMTSAAQWPALHAAVDVPDDATAEALCARSVAAAGVVEHGLEVVVAFHAATGAATVLEGDVVTPALAARRLFAGVPVARRVRAVFLHDPEPARLYERMRGRGRGFQLLSPAAGAREVRRALLYGDWVRREAERRGLAVVDAGGTPEEVTARVIAALAS
jgi:2-phosphoglycerate kinase